MNFKKHILVCLVGIGFAQWSIAQHDIGAITNVYSNPVYIQDSLRAFVRPKWGYRLFDKMLNQSISNINENLFIPEVPFDTNAYSIVDFRLGNAPRPSTATQSVGVALVRPLSRNSKLKFGLNRTSNAGWVPRTYVRKTDINIGSSHQVTKRWKLYADASFMVNDREQSGGLLDSNFVREANSAANVELVSNIALSQAFNRISSHQAQLGNEIEIVEAAGGKWSVGVVTSGSLFTHTYEDLAPDSVFYDTYGGDTGLTYQDSLKLRAVTVSPYLLYERDRSDSSGQDRIEVKVGLEQNWNWVRNNGQFSKPLNQSLYTNFKRQTSNAESTVGAEYFVAGYNQSDYHAFMSHRQYLYSHVDTNGNAERLFLKGKVNLLATRPALIYENYRSEVRDVSNMLKQVYYSQYSVGIGYERSRISITAEGDYTKLENHVYFDALASVNQAINPIELYGLSAGVAYNGKSLAFATEGRYQWNNRSRVYSLPEWINVSTLSYTWPMFKEKLKMRIGGRSKFYSGYFARGYLPFYDSFYVQDTKKFRDYFQLDAFIYLRIKTVDVGFNIVNTTYGLLGYNPNAYPYYPAVAPNYASVPRYFQLHINWFLRN